MRLLRGVWERPGQCLLPFAAIALGLSYLFAPIDLIPDRTPYIGHLDEVFFVVLGLVIARMILPENIRLEAMPVVWKRSFGGRSLTVRSRVLERIGAVLHRLFLWEWPDGKTRAALALGLANVRTPAPTAIDLFGKVPAARRRVSQLLTLDLIRAGKLPSGQRDRRGLAGIVPQSGDPLAFWEGPPLAFLHFEKTAGTAVADLLTRRFHPLQIDQDPNRSAPPHLISPFAGPSASRIRRRALLWGHYDLPALRRIDPGRAVLTMLREPSARIVSLYHYWRSVDPSYVDEAGSNFQIVAAHQLDLLGFLQCRDPWIVDYIDNVYVRRLCGLYASAEAVDPLRADPEAALAAARERLRSLEIVGVVERMGPSLGLAGRVLGVEFGPELKVVNRTGDAPLGEFRRIDRTPIDDRIRAELTRLTRLDRVLYDEAIARL